MKVTLQSDLFHFKIWYRKQITIYNKQIEAEKNYPVLDQNTLDKLVVEKLKFIRSAAIKVVEIYKRYGHYSHL
jgi:hypothetical protein